MQELTQSRHKERRHVGAFVDDTERERLYELARREDRSVSAIIRRALRAELERSQVKA